MLLTSPLNLVPTAPDYRAYRLKCRFQVGAALCHQKIGPGVSVCHHLETSAYTAGRIFLDAMEHDGWRPVDGNLTMTAGPLPATPVDASALPPAVKVKRERGPHARFGPAYTSPIVEKPTLATTDIWEYELSGLFVRKLMPTVATVNAIQQLEEKRSRRGQSRP